MTNDFKDKFNEKEKQLGCNYLPSDAIEHLDDPTNEEVIDQLIHEASMMRENARQLHDMAKELENEFPDTN